MSTENSMIKPEFLGHPQGLFYLFFAELWERFSFYGMRALLTLYMVDQIFAALANKDTVAAIIYSSYGSLVYAFPVIGGKIADEILGYRKSIFLGGILMTVGHFVLAFEYQATFFLALSFIIIGNGFFKPNISTFVGTLYPHADPKKDAGFTIFYMGINIGAFTAPLFCGWLAREYGWHYGFGLAGLGMALGLIFFWSGIRNNVFGDKGMPPKPELLESTWAGLKLKYLVPALAVLAVPAISLLLSSYTYIGGGETMFGNSTWVNLIFYALGILILAYLGYELYKCNLEERKKLAVAIFITLFMMLFWGFFELSGSTLTLFADRNVNLKFMDAAQSNAINPIFITLLAIPVSIAWQKLSKRGLNPRTPYKSAFGLVLLGLSFYVLSISQGFADESGKVPFFFLIAMYGILSTGELFMSPVGLSKITDLSPKRIVAFMMGVWFLSSAFAFQIVGFIGQQLAIDKIEATAEGGQASALEMLNLYTGGFESIAYVSFAGAILTFILAPLLTKWMKEVV